MQLPRMPVRVVPIYPMYKLVPLYLGPVIVGADIQPAATAGGTDVDFLLLKLQECAYILLHVQCWESPLFC